MLIFWKWNTVICFPTSRVTIVIHDENLHLDIERESDQNI